MQILYYYMLMLRSTTNILIFFLALLPALVFPQDKIKIAVMDLTAKAGIDVMKVSTLTDVLCTSVSDLSNYDILSREDIRTMLSHVQDQQLLGCDDIKCIIKIGGALGVQQIVSGNIGMVGDTYVINLELIDVDNIKVLKRISEKYAGNESGLIETIENCVSLLFEKNSPVKKHEKTKKQMNVVELNNDGNNRGSVIVESTPADARVYLDNVYLGAAPIKIKNIDAGEHQLKLSMVGYDDFDKKINVEVGSLSTESVFLKKTKSKSSDAVYIWALILLAALSYAATFAH